jgi:hypothetical protein
MCEIPLDIANNELDRRIKVFGGNHFGMSLTIKCTAWSFAPCPPRPFSWQTARTGRICSPRRWPRWNRISAEALIHLTNPKGG